MKKALAVIAQFFLFLLVFLAGSFFPPFHLKWGITHPTATSTHFFVPDGLLLMIGLFVLILLIELGTKKLRTAGILTATSFVLALIVGLASKFGFVSQSLF